MTLADVPPLSRPSPVPSRLVARVRPPASRSHASRSDLCPSAPLSSAALPAALCPLCVYGVRRLPEDRAHVHEGDTVSSPGIVEGVMRNTRPDPRERIGMCSARSLPEPCRQNNSPRSGNPPSAHGAAAWRRPQTLGAQCTIQDLTPGTVRDHGAERPDQQPDGGETGRELRQARRNGRGRARPWHGPFQPHQDPEDRHPRCRRRTGFGRAGGKQAHWVNNEFQIGKLNKLRASRITVT